MIRVKQHKNFLHWFEIKAGHHQKKLINRRFFCCIVESIQACTHFFVRSWDPCKPVCIPLFGARINASLYAALCPLLESIIIIIIKTTSTGPSDNKNKIVYKSITQPHKHLRHGKNETQTHGNNQRLTALLNPSNVPVSNSVGKVIPHRSLGRQETPCRLGRSTPWYFKL